MTRHSRRRFLRSAAAVGALPAVLGPRAADAQQPNADPAPDSVVVNAVIYTVDERRPTAAAFAVKNGRFVAVGGNDDVRRLAGAGTRVIDAAGATIVPGFIDAHTHPADAGVSELRYVDCNRTKTAELQDVIRTRAAATPAGEWVFGWKFDDTKLADGPLTRAALDAAAPNHPVRVLHRGGHTAYFNSPAFKLAGVTRDTPDPVGGKFGRDEKGEPTGFAAETALPIFAKVGREPPVTPADRRAGVKLISEMMCAAGLTSVHDVLASKEDFVAYQDALAAGEMGFRVYILCQAPFFRELRAAGIRPGFGNPHLRLGGLKLFCDGSASERTMRMSTPYIGRPNDYGILVTPRDALLNNLREAHDAGWQVGVHANGDVAIDIVLSCFELALKLNPRPNPRPRIEHCTLVNPDLLKRIAALGAIPMPFYTYVYFHGDKWAHYGDEKVKWMFAHRSFLDHGIRVAAASDYVPGPFEPLMAIQSMTTRKDYRGRLWGENQKITVDEALRVCTINAAYASFEDHVKGSITPGKFADYVMLAADPHKTEPDRIKDIQVVKTVVAGKAVWPKAET
jgi:hypothetical protein